jgi:zinc finger protein
MIRSSSGTVKIPELGLAMEPGPASQGFITNVEGILMRFEDIVKTARRWNQEDAEKVVICDRILEKLKLAMEGEEELTVVIEDPFGNSMIVSDDAFWESLSEEEASELKTGMTVIEIAGDEIE